MLVKLHSWQTQRMHLTPTERKVLNLAKEGLDCREIAAVRNRSHKTVETQLAILRIRFDTHTMHGLIVEVLRHQLLDLTVTRIPGRKRNG